MGADGRAEAVREALQTLRERLTSEELPSPVSHVAVRVQGAERAECVSALGVYLTGLVANVISIDLELADRLLGVEGDASEQLAADVRMLIGESALGIDGDIDTGRTAGTKPLPKTIGFLQSMSYRLSLTAGGMVALWAVGQQQEPAGDWELPTGSQRALEMLPLALRSGCGDLSSLAWYRFGCRYRVPAHILSRAFPIPADRAEDAQARAWVRDRRRAWLDGEGPDPALDARYIIALRRVLTHERAA